jgi:hypothetical protein
MAEITSLSLASLSALDHRTIIRSSGVVVVQRDRTGCGGYDLWLPAGEVAMYGISGGSGQDPSRWTQR